MYIKHVITGLIIRVKAARKGRDVMNYSNLTRKHNTSYGKIVRLQNHQIDKVLTNRRHFCRTFNCM